MSRHHFQSAMSSTATHEHVAGLLATFNIEIGSLPDDLKCGQCRGVLKDACQVPCGCRFCRLCIDEEVARGTQFCPGGAQECRGTHLSTAVPDYRANKSISKLTGKCPHAGCSHECPLADMEAHLRVCLRESVYCPFRELGCQQSKLAAEEMSGHLLQESRSHSEILIGLIANINREMALLKLDNEASKAKIKMLECQLVVKDEQIKSTMDELGHVQNENKSVKDEIESIRDKTRSMKDEMKSVRSENNLIKDENKSMKGQIESIKTRCNLIGQEKEVLSELVRRLEGRLDREIEERRENDERDSTMETAITETIGSSRDALESEMERVRGDIRSIKRDIDSLKGQVQSARVALGLGRVDASCDEWLIDVDVSKTELRYLAKEKEKTSDKFTGVTQPYTCQLASFNFVGPGLFWVCLRIWAGPSDAQLQWPFRGVVTVTVAHRDNAKKCSRQTMQCEIKRPPDHDYSGSAMFEFPHAALRRAGLDLKRGVRVSCQIVPGQE